MNKLLLTLLATLTIATTANAEHCCYRGGYHREGYYGGGIGWVAPALIGGAIGYELSQPRTVVIEPPIVVQQPPIVAQPPVGYHYAVVTDPACNCQKTALLPN
jgi:hypothetical protein